MLFEKTRVIPLLILEKPTRHLRRPLKIRVELYEFLVLLTVTGRTYWHFRYDGILQGMRS